MTPDITRDVVLDAESLARSPRRDAVVVLVASHDPEAIAYAGPRLARQLYAGRRFGEVVWSEPTDAPEWAPRGYADWSEVAVEELPVWITTKGATPIPKGARSR